MSIPAELTDDLASLLQSVEDRARATHSRYDRKTRNYPWNDEIWREADASEFQLVSRIRAALLTRRK